MGISTFYAVASVAYLELSYDASQAEVSHERSTNA